MTDEELTPADLIRSYGVLRGAVTPLAVLAKTSPRLLEDIITLAMAMGIHAAECKREQDRKIELVTGLMDRATESLWRNQA